MDYLVVTNAYVKKVSAENNIEALNVFAGIFGMKNYDEYRKSNVYIPAYVVPVADVEKELAAN